MEIDLGCPALALVTTQDTAGILRRTSGTRVFGITVVSISRGWAQYLVLQTKDTSFWSFLTFALRGRRFLIFWGAFSGRYFILSRFEGHVRFERIFGKISEHVKAAKSVDCCTRACRYIVLTLIVRKFPSNMLGAYVPGTMSCPSAVVVIMDPSQVAACDTIR